VTALSGARRGAACAGGSPQGGRWRRSRSSPPTSSLVTRDRDRGGARRCRSPRATLDQLVEGGWVCPRGAREVPGRPVTW
jgi:hypothetical protein